MKFRMYILVLMLLPVVVMAEEVTIDSISGKWLFTHMILDGESEQPVNIVMEFLPDGEIISFSAAGDEIGRGTFSVQPQVITYSDKNGDQTWKVIEFGCDNLHVDHSGAEMFFKKQ